ncbi:MAG: TIGR01777 family oxidoreductase [Gemmatimonadaceae bacterium]
MRIAITGASGFIGQPLQDELRRAGHTVLAIGRPHSSGRAPDVPWDPASGRIDAARLEGIDGLVHLAGENIAQRWTDGARRKIMESRVHGTRLIAHTIAALDPRPSVLVSMSGVNAYGDRGDEVLYETSSHGRGFLADVTVAWEQSADPARMAGIRVVHPRMGPVLHKAGGPLQRLVPIFSLGVGGPIGSGRQWMSWISRVDVIAALQFLLEAPSLSGPVNLVAPSPVRNADFTEMLGRVLHRPAVVPVPEFAVKLAFGQMGMETVIAGQRAHPDKLLASGFRFRFPELEPALRDALA